MGRFDFFNDRTDCNVIKEERAYEGLLKKYLSAGKNADVLKKFLRHSKLSEENYTKLISNCISLEKDDLKYEHYYSVFTNILSYTISDLCNDGFDHRFPFKKLAHYIVFETGEKGCFKSFCDKAYDYISVVMDKPIAILRKYYDSYVSDERSFDYWMLVQGYDLLFNEYPLAFRLSCDILNSSVLNLCECINRIHNDRVRISKEFGIDTGQRIVDLKDSVSDRHNGKTVIIVYFDDGSKIVYKPRNMSIDLMWQSIVDFFNTINEGHITLRAAKSINMGEYGYMEYIKYSPVIEEDSFPDYYKRCGSILALVSILGGSDLHHDNIIVANGYPYLIDVETLISPVVKREYTTVESADDNEYGSLINTNIMRTLLLTKWVGKNADDALDIGGFSAVNPGKENYPIRKSGNPVFVDEYESDFIKGFSECCKYLMKNTDGFMRLLDSIKSVYTRFVLRNTRVYYRLIEHFSNPVFLKNGNIYKCAASRTYAPYLLSCTDSVCKKIWKMIEVEEQSLSNINIPIFMSKGNSSDLYDHKGKILVRDFFRDSPYDMVTKNVHLLTEGKIDKQAELLQKIFLLSREQRDESFKMIWSYEDTDRFFSDRKVSDKEIRKEISGIADIVLSSLSYTSDYWFIAPVKDTLNCRYQMSILENQLYGGSLGIYIFLVLFFDAFGLDMRLESLKEHIYSYTKEIIDSESLLKFEDISYTEGIAGLLHMLHYVWKITKDNRFRECIIDILDQLKERLTLPEDVETDFFNGISGMLYVISDICEDLDNCSEAFLAMIESLTVMIMEKTEKKTGLWIDYNTDYKPLLGWAHGQCGYAAALSKALRFIVSDDTRIRAQNCIKRIFIYENQMYDNEENNLPDFRKFNVEIRDTYPMKYKKRFMYGNCSGIVGTVQIALIVNKYYQLENIDEWIGRVKKFFDDTRLVGNDSLCCGTSAWVDLLIEISKITEHREWAETKIRQIISSRIDGGYIFNSLKKINDISLFRGISGVGYTLLRYVFKYPIAVL